MSELQWLYLDLNSFFTSVEQQLRPELRAKPVAVVPALTDATCAIAASYEAKAYGIKTGTKIYEAKRLCPELICIPADHERYVYFHHRIKRCIESHLPVYRAESIDEFSCQLDISQRNEHEARALALNIKEHIHDEIGPHLRSSVGLGPNRFLAKTASNLEKPNGLQCLHASDAPVRLASLPIQTLVGIGKGMQRRLWGAGVTTVGQLYSLAPKQMRQIWGSVQGERYYYLLRGIELCERPTERRGVSHSHILEPQWRPAERAQEVMRRLVLKAASRLRRLDYQASALSMSIRVERGPRLSQMAQFEACYDNLTLLNKAQELWHSLLEGYPAQQRLKKVSLVLHNLCPSTQAHRQLDMFNAADKFSQERRKRSEQISHAMDDLNSRFGRDTISLGGQPKRARCFSGTKVAFTRIPSLEEFHE